MNNDLAAFLLSISRCQDELKEVINNSQKYQNVIVAIKKVSSNIDSSPLSLAKIKDFEFKIIEKNIDKLYPIIEEIKLIRYLSIGIVNKNIEIVFDKSQEETYETFYRQIQLESTEIKKYDVNSLKIQFEETKKIHDLLATGKNIPIDFSLLEILYEDFGIPKQVQLQINQYINSITNKSTNVK